MTRNAVRWLLAGYFVVLLCYSIFSYSLTDPNLVLSSWQPYWQFQSWMWQTFFENRQVLTLTYGVLVTFLFVLYSWFVVEENVQQALSREVTTKAIVVFLLVISPLLFSYNALSHDVFNYIFNAKMVLVYGADPHQQVALDFSQDLWTRFMHNTHTPAPYGYGWTAVSLLPFILGNQVFLVTWLLFRVLSLTSILLLYYALQQLAQRVLGRALKIYELAIVFLNPLFLIEVISNNHNDLWMIAPAILAFGLVLRTDAKHWYSKYKWLFAGVLMAVSISIKFATVLLMPLFLFIFFERKIVTGVLKSRVPIVGSMSMFNDSLTSMIEKLWKPFIPLLASIALFLPLVTPRSQLFHPWYLVWVLAWIPLIKNKWWRTFVLLLSFSSLLRYLPWLYAGGFEEKTLMYQQLITWSVVFFVFLVMQNRKKL